jgi:hypothetical protein
MVQLKWGNSPERGWLKKMVFPEAVRFSGTLGFDYEDQGYLISWNPSMAKSCRRK